jgi:hypothetical protein
VSTSNAKLSPADWATVITLYSRGEKSIRELAVMFKVAPQSIHEGLRKRGTKKGSALGDVTREVEDEAAAAHKQRVQAAHQTAERYQKYNELLIQLTVKKIADANTAGTLSAINADILTLKNGMAILAKGRKEACEIGKVEEMLQQDEELAQLNVGEYTEEELEAIRAANEEAYQQSLDDVDNLDIDDLDDADDGDEEDEED